MVLCKKRMRANETALEQHNILAALSRRSTAAVGGGAKGGQSNPDQDLLLELAEKRSKLAEEVEVCRF